MPSGRFPHGFVHGIEISRFPMIGMQPGNVFWVNSAIGRNGNPGTKTKPFATLDYAIGRCTANNGDIILLAPNHAETITGVGGITADVAGISIISLGTYNQRARFLMDGGTTVSFLVSAADVTVQNCVFASGHADVVTCFDVTGKGFTALGNEFVDNVVDENFKSCFKFSGAANTSDGAKIIGNRFVTPDAATLGFILCVDDIRDLIVRENFVASEGTGLATLITCTTGKDLQFCDIRYNFLSSKATAGNLFISNDTASPNNSGIIAHNRCGHADVTTTHTMGAVGGCRFFDNLSTSLDSASGFVLPAIDTDA
jgi:hypothetical protein